MRFPSIPGVSYDVAHVFNTRLLYFRGPEFNESTESGILAEPPIPLALYPGLLPQVDQDGNDLGGLRSTTLQAPLGTYTGWNTRRAGFSEGDSCDLTGSYIPFAVHAADRPAGDPRPSLEERYGNHDGYVAAVTRAAQGWCRKVSCCRMTPRPRSARHRRAPCCSSKATRSAARYCLVEPYNRRRTR